MEGFNLLLILKIMSCFGGVFIIIFGIDVFYGFIGENFFFVVVVVVMKNWFDVFYFVIWVGI